ncbi:hypothetical protein K3495_g15051, partial [Podosphaera aphanis]
EYQEHNLKGLDLFTFWQADFENFDVAAYKKTTEGTRILRDFLYLNGVFIPKNRKSIAENLIASAKAWVPWPVESASYYHQKEQNTMINSPSNRQIKTEENQHPNNNKDASNKSKTKDQATSDCNMDYPHSKNASYNLINLSKIYTDDLKYSGDDDSFDYKYGIFIDLCEKVEVPRDAYFKAFSTMLKGAALNHFYTSIKTNPRITQLFEICEDIRNTFEGSEFKRSNLTKWNNMTLKTILENNPEKNVESCFQLLVNELRSTQMMLQSNFQDDATLQNKLILACQAHPACSIGCSIPASSSIGLINNLRLSISNYLAVHKSPEQNQFLLQSDISSGLNNEQYIIDRKYHSNRQSRNSTSHSSQKFKQDGQTKRCFICKKNGCWSTRHSKEERERAKSNFREKYNRAADRRYTQYVAEFEGTDEEEFNEEEIEALISDLERAEPNDNDTFLTEVGEIDHVVAHSLVSKLADRSASHALLKSNDNIEYLSSEESLVAEPQQVNCRYGPEKFHGIMIDTGAAGKSTAGYNQFLAYNQLFTDTRIDTDYQGAVNVTFGIGSTTSIGSVSIPTPIGICVFHVVKADTPFLLSLEEMDRKGVIFNNVNNQL